MTKEKNLVQKLPERLISSDVSLFNFASSPWTFIDRMTPQKRQQFTKAMEFPPRYIDILSTYRGHKQFRALLRKRETVDTRTSASMPSRYYWIHSAAHQGFVGYISAHVPRVNLDILTVGSEILPQYRRMGIGTGALKMLSDFALGKGITNCFCAEVERGNPSADMAVKAGFREIRGGKCTISILDCYQGVRMRRFIKTGGGNTPDIWPVLKR